MQSAAFFDTKPYDVESFELAGALVAVLVLIVLIVAFAYLFPDIFSNVLDHILYSKEELQLLGR